MKFVRFSLLALLGAGLSLASCVKQPNDAPPDTTGYDPKLPVNISIRDLKAKNNVYSPNGSGDDTLLITEDLTAYGIVIANDQSGNLYKQIVIQDSTGGIAINIDDYRLYTAYPVGRKIYLNLKGMMLSYNGGTPVLGGGVDERKASVGLSGQQITRHIVKADVGHVAQDTVVDFDVVRNFTVADEYLLNRLITIRGVQFADQGKTYTEPTATTNRNIQTCAATTATLTVRTSNYANFHAAQLPSGNGSITGIYTVFVNTSGTQKTPQLLIRDTNDVKFTDLRCGPLFAQDFGAATTGDINLAGWTNVALSGTTKWKYSSAGSTSNPYAVMSAFNTTTPTVESWLITPGIDLPTQDSVSLSFRNANGFDNGATLKLYVSDNFTGTVTTASWTELSFTRAALSANGFSGFTSSGNISLAAYRGKKVWIAWRYEGGDPGRTTTWEIDDVKVGK
ncbi:MAG: DUF5017 domain-containing protein [Sphingobacteriales bacterium]|nr:MAG: DUF5017 domain-containing protein [Sphingobacteriales bacterium]